MVWLHRVLGLGKFDVEFVPARRRQFQRISSVLVSNGLRHLPLVSKRHPNVRNAAVSTSVLRSQPNVSNDSTGWYNSRCRQVRVMKVLGRAFEGCGPGTEARGNPTSVCSGTVDEVFASCFEWIAAEGSRPGVDVHTRAPGWNVPPPTLGDDHLDAALRRRAAGVDLDHPRGEDVRRTPEFAWRAARGTARRATARVNRFSRADPGHEEHRHQPDAAHTCLTPPSLRSPLSDSAASSARRLAEGLAKAEGLH